MSTYLYLQCFEHDPPIMSDGEVGQHLYDLPRIRKEIANRHIFAEILKRDIAASYGHHFTSNAARFLATHQKCRIGIEDEYGRAHPIQEDVDDSLVVGQRVRVRPVSEPWLEGICFGGEVIAVDDEWVQVLFDNGQTRAVKPYNVKGLCTVELAPTTGDQTLTNKEIR